MFLVVFHLRGDGEHDLVVVGRIRPFLRARKVLCHFRAGDRQLAVSRRRAVCAAGVSGGHYHPTGECCHHRSSVHGPSLHDITLHPFLHAGTCAHGASWVGSREWGIRTLRPRVRDLVRGYDRPLTAPADGERAVARAEGVDWARRPAEPWRPVGSDSARPDALIDLRRELAQVWRG
jgi:hypothetical protein